ncbi:MAG: hypothetical protein JNK34_05125 [Tabrizicola sp.]|nr:hypothetical protein [Tabrizicola sp.]
MMARLRTLKVLAVLLYIGPLFAGAAGQGISSIPPFVAIFVVWLIVLRPEQWPASAEEWSTLPAWGAALTILLSQTALVCVLFALGRGIGAVAGLEFVFDPLLPLAVSFVSIPICRMLWDSGEAAMAGVYLDDEARAAHAPRAASLAAASVVPLLNLPDDFAHSLATDAVSLVMEPAGSDLRLKALVAALSNPDRSHASLRRSVMLWATEPEIVAPGAIPGVMASAFDIIGRDLDLMRLYVPRALALIAAFPDRAEDFPSPERLRKTTEEAALNNPEHDLPADLRADLCDGLLALARAVEVALQRLSLAG